MNLRLTNKLVEISRAMKPIRATGQFFHTSSLIRKNRVVCIGWNNYLKGHPEKRFGKYENYKGFPGTYKSSLHAEISSIIKLGEEDLSDYVMVNIRVGNFNQITMSKACLNCQRVLKSLGLKSLYYSNEQGNFEQWEY